MPHDKREDQISNIVIGECLKIHKKVGPGLFESVYEKILYHELTGIGLKVSRQVPIKVWYNSMDFGIGFKADLVIEDLVIVELKSVESILPVHEKQLMTYLKLTGMKLGMLINFDVNLLKNGITRVVNDL